MFIERQLMIVINNQVAVINYHEIFTPISKMVIIHTFLIVVVTKTWTLPNEFL